MADYLKKIFTTALYQPPDEITTIPAYSYYRDDQSAGLTASGKQFIIDTLVAAGFTANDQTFFLFSLFHSEWSGLDTLAFGWYAEMAMMPKADGSGWEKPAIIPLKNSHTDTPLGGTWVAVPETTSSITPEPYHRESSIIGWDGSAVLNGSFKSLGSCEFSVAAAVEGVFCGLTLASQSEGSNYEAIKYAIYFQSGIYRISIDNTDVGFAYEAYADLDKFKIEIESFAVKFYKNNVLKHTHALAETHTETFVLDASLFKSGDKIADAIINRSIVLSLDFAELDIVKSLNNESILQWEDVDEISVYTMNILDIDFTDEDSMVVLEEGANAILWEDVDEITVLKQLIIPPSILDISFVDTDTIFSAGFPFGIAERNLSALMPFLAVKSLTALSSFYAIKHINAIIGTFVAEKDLAAQIKFLDTAEKNLTAKTEIKTQFIAQKNLTAVIDLAEKIPTQIVDVTENKLIKL